MNRSGRRLGNRNKMAKNHYKDAGVDLEVYRQAMRSCRGRSRGLPPRVLPLEGGFAGLFQLDFTNPLFARHYKNPVLVSCTDGVGTKLKVAAAAGVHNTVGHRSGGHERQRRFVLRGRTAVFPGLRGDAQGRSRVALEQLIDGVTAGCIQADFTCWAARRPFCPSMPPAITTSRVFASASPTATASSTAARSSRAMW